MRLKMMVLVLASILATAVNAQAKTTRIRATDLRSSVWAQLSKLTSDDLLVEFQQGDELPITIESKGDLLETHQTGLNTVIVKKNFLVHFSQAGVEISFDGHTYKKIGDALKGSIGVGAGSVQNGGVADAINIIFEAYVK